MEIKLVLDKETADMLRTIATYLMAGINAQNAAPISEKANVATETASNGQQYSPSTTAPQGATGAVPQNNPTAYQQMPFNPQTPINYQQPPINYQQQSPQQVPAAQSAVQQQSPQQMPQQAPQQMPPQQQPSTAAQGAIPQQVPVNYQQPGQQPPPAYQQPIPSSTPVQSYTLAQLQVAAGGLSMQGKAPVLYQIMAQFGVQAMTELPKERYGEFAVALRGAGAQI
jgi:hypothetical protein